MPIEQFPLIEVSGPPHERGRQYGAQAADRVRRGVQHYTSQFARLGLEPSAIGPIVEGYLPAMNAFAGDLVEEMRGIADGADVSFEDVVLLNARTELLHMARSRAGRTTGPLDDTPDGCTGVVVLPSAAADGRLIHAQNWDWKAECAETAIVLRINRPDGPDVLTFTEAGSVARSGLNSAGLAVTANYIESDRDFREPGVPLAFVRRKILEAAHMAEAMHTIVTTRKLTSNNVMLSHRQGVAIDFECAPNETFAVYPEDGILVHANHWVSPAGLSKYRDVGILNTPESFYRDWRVREALKPKCGALTREHVKEALRDDFGSPWAVCRPPRPTPFGDLTATVAMLVIDSTAGTLEVTPLPALNRDSTTYALPLESRPAA